MTTVTLPPEVRPYARTTEFTEASIPGSLLRSHATKPDVWARIQVLEGRLRYCVLDDDAQGVVLEGGSVAIVAPEVRHRVEAVGTVRFFVEFLK